MSVVTPSWHRFNTSNWGRIALDTRSLNSDGEMREEHEGQTIHSLHQIFSTPNMIVHQQNHFSPLRRNLPETAGRQIASAWNDLARQLWEDSINLLGLNTVRLEKTAKTFITHQRHLADGTWRPVTRVASVPPQAPVVPTVVIVGMIYDPATATRLLHRGDHSSEGSQVVRDYVQLSTFATENPNLRMHTVGIAHAPGDVKCA